VKLVRRTVIYNLTAGESTFIFVVRIFMEQLQILFRYNATRGIIEIFTKQLAAIPKIH
jgi:hypothetical protein